MFPTEKFYTTVSSNEYSALDSIQHVEGKKSSEQSSFHRVRELAGSYFDLLGSGSGLFQAQDNVAELAELANFDNMYFDVVSPSFQSCDESKEKRSSALPSTSPQILCKHGIRRQKLDDKKPNIGSINIRGLKPSTEAIIEMAAQKYIQSTSQSSNKTTMFKQHVPDSILGLSEEDLKGVQLIQNLLSCAEKVSEKQYDRARKLLHECYKMSSCTGTPIQRLAFCFVEAIHEKIDKETGRITLKDLGKKHVDTLEILNWLNTFLIAFHKEHPLSQIAKLTGVQAIVDHVAEASKVHIIDFEIRIGIQHIILMQVLADRCENPIQHLKVTAVGTRSKSLIKETGKHLMIFAQSLDLKFSFDIVMVEDILDLNENHFKLDADEVVAVSAAYTLTKLVGRADRLENVMRVIKNINPCLMVVTEIEANCNSPTFVGRFVEALFFFGAFFDSLADCMKNDEKIRREAESTCFSLFIKNVLAAEGEEREIRYVSINVWRAFFASYGLVEIEPSTSSLCHANLVLQSFSCGSSCTLDRNGKGLTIGWKGTPLSSLSAWKFK